MADTNTVVQMIYHDKIEQETFNPNNIELPIWSIEEYFEQLNDWRLSRVDDFGTPGFFYFKIFFDFNTDNGLFGDIARYYNLTESDFIDNTGINLNTKGNSALSYLKNALRTGRYSSMRLGDRANALIKFFKYMKWISETTPWFFKKLQGLLGAEYVKYTEDKTENKTLTIECLQEAIDMRLGTLFDLYKFACYDNINYREILPENMRKFNMSVMVMNVPYRGLDYDSYAHGEILGGRSTFDSIDNMPAFKLYTFKNCEFDIENTNTISNDIEITKPFMIEQVLFKIKYNRCYQHRYNPFDGHLFGDTGIIYDDPNSFDKPDATNKRTYNKHTIDIPEPQKLATTVNSSLINSLGRVSASVENNLYDETNLSSLQGEILNTNYDNSFTDQKRAYYDSVTDTIKQNENRLQMLNEFNAMVIDGGYTGDIVDLVEQLARKYNVETLK